MSPKRVKRVCFFGGYDPMYPRNNLLRKGLRKLGVEVVECRTSPRRRVFSRYPLLAWRFLRVVKRCDVLLVPEFRHKDVLLAFMLGKLTGKRVVFDPLVSRYDTKIADRGDASDGSYQARHNRNLDRWSLALCDLVLADTAAHADYYSQEFGVRRDKVCVLPVGFDEDVFRRDPGGEGRRPGGALRVVFVGNYLPLHGADVIVAAARILRDDDQLEFVLIGRGQTYPQIEAYAKRFALKNVVLRPRITLSEMAEELRKADVSLGIFGRTAKATRVVPNKVYQSMAMGCAVVTGDTPAIREYFADGENVFLVPVGEPDALANELREHAHNRERLKEVGSRAAAWVHDRFTSTSIAKQLLRFFNERLTY